MASLSTPKRNSLNLSELGPLLDDGTPYSGLKNIEFERFRTRTLPNWNGVLDPLPEQIRHRAYWQNGAGNHASPALKIIGSIFIPLYSDCNNPIFDRQLVLDCSSQWVVGRNVTRKCKIENIGCNKLVLPNQDIISLINHDLYTFIPYKAFLAAGSFKENFAKLIYCATARIQQAHDKSSSKKENIIDGAHNHVCGHATYTDRMTLLVRNNI